VKSILLKVPYILEVLAINKGKSLSYLLTVSLITSRITIVVLPLVGLKEDLLRRTKDFKIPTSIYKKSSSFTTLTLVSIKTMVNNASFISSLVRLIQKDRVDRIVIDKCHLLITSYTYRSIMF
jgi:superfamily II DNA helicase RecQ